MKRKEEDPEECLDTIFQEFRGTGVILETGDVVRLGRVCYIVKETSIDVGERVIKELEAYALNKNQAEWKRLLSNGDISGSHQAKETSNGKQNLHTSFPKEWESYHDATS